MNLLMMNADGLHKEFGQTASFSTMRDGKLRTVGTGYIPPVQWNELEHWGPAEAQTLARMMDANQDNPKATARGKVFLLGYHKDELTCCCFQVKKHDAQLVFCGNCSAAAMAMISKILGVRDIEVQYICDNEAIRISAQVQSAGSGWYVEQQYNMQKKITIQNALFDGREAAYCSILNPYLFIKGPVRTDPTQMLERLYENSHVVNEKVVILEANGSLPKATFYNCNGMHGAAPMTGLASLALVAEQVPWIAEMCKDGAVQTPAGTDYLPPISMQENMQYSIQMPQAFVHLNTHSFKMI